MNTLLRCIAIWLPAAVCMPASGQIAPGAAAGDQPGAGPAAVAPSRLLAGLRSYPDEVVEAIVQLAGRPEIIRGAAEALDTGQEPVPDALGVPAELLAPFEVLAQMPELLLLLASRPDELETLRSFWSVAPEGSRLRLRQLREAYARLAREAARAWQQGLERDPVALGEYRTLLTEYCQAERELNPGFACVRVRDRRYYYACPPDETVIAYAAQARPRPALSRVLDAWQAEYSPQRIDAKVEARRVPAADDRPPAGSVYEQSPAERAGMWEPSAPGAADVGLGLIPVILQPSADQPEEARLAVAVTEHARLWSPPGPAGGVEAPVEEAAAAAPGQEGQTPDVIVEEAPGPLSAYRSDDRVWSDELDDEDYDYARPYYGGSYYGRFYYDPLFGWPGYSLAYPGSVRYLCPPYYGSGIYGYGGYQAGVRGYVSYRSGGIHYGGGRHYGYCSGTGRGRTGRHVPVIRLRTSAHREAAGVYRHHSASPAVGQRAGDHRRTTSRIERRCAVSGAVRTGLPARPTALREAYRSRDRALSAGTRTVRPETRITRSAPPSSRSAVRSAPPRSSGSHATGSRPQSGVRRR